jgi:hypothetical protein
MLGPDSHGIDALVLAIIGTGSLLLVSRNVARFRMGREVRAWMVLAWLLLFVATVLVYRALRA